MEIVYNAIALGALDAPTEKQLRFFEIENDNRLFVSLCDVGKILGYKGTSSSGRSTAPSLLEKALAESENHPIKCLVYSTSRNSYLQGVDLNRLPLTIQKFIEFLVNAQRHYEKYNLYFDNSCKLLDWLDTKIIPLFYDVGELSPEEIRLQKKREYNQRWQEQHPDKAREYRRRWKAKNPDYQKRWRKNNREHVREQNRRWRENNPDYMKQWRESHREQILEYQRQYAARERAERNAALASLFPGNAS